jgi:hypothetical protein
MNGVDLERCNIGLENRIGQEKWKEWKPVLSATKESAHKL